MHRGGQEEFLLPFLIDEPLEHPSADREAGPGICGRTGIGKICRAGGYPKKRPVSEMKTGPASYLFCLSVLGFFDFFLRHSIFR